MGDRENGESFTKACFLDLNDNKRDGERLGSAGTEPIPVFIALGTPLPV